MSTPQDSVTLSLARVEVKLDQLLAQSGDHEKRLRRLEEKPTGDDRWWKLACLVLAGGAAGTAGIQQLIGG